MKLITSWPTLSEAVTLLLYHYGYSHALALLQSLPGMTFLSPLESECREAVALFPKFNKDQLLSFNDLVTYVMVKGRLKNIPILTFDADFSKVGLAVFCP